jgi:hypothetical protein
VPPIHPSSSPTRHDSGVHIPTEQWQAVPAPVVVARQHPDHSVAPQGEEAKVVVLSLVRNNKAGNIGFLKMQNRINVLLSRAQHGMYLLGNMDTLLAGSGDKAPMWRQVLTMLTEAGCVATSFQVGCRTQR